MLVYCIVAHYFGVSVLVVFCALMRRKPLRLLAVDPHLRLSSTYIDAVVFSHAWRRPSDEERHPVASEGCQAWPMNFSCV